MIITKQKEFNELLDALGKEPVFIIGCSECATMCQTGGEKEVLKMKSALEDKNIQITGWVILEPACHLQNDRRLLRPNKEEVDRANKILVLACGNGVQTISEIIEDTDVIAGNDTLFLGEIIHANDFEKRCTMCGECIQDFFGGFCPISRCPKSMLNGPCGGSVNGKCEVDPKLDCVWNLIYERLKRKGQLEQLNIIQKAKNWSKSAETSRVL